eukprot:5282111-Karenia_brevis.AAC.1
MSICWPVAKMAANLSTLSRSSRMSPCKREIVNASIILEVDALTPDDNPGILRICCEPLPTPFPLAISDSCSSM